MPIAPKDCCNSLFSLVSFDSSPGSQRHSWLPVILKGFPYSLTPNLQSDITASLTCFLGLFSGVAFLFDLCLHVYFCPKMCRPPRCHCFNWCYQYHSRAFLPFLNHPESPKPHNFIGGYTLPSWAVIWQLVTLLLFQSTLYVGAKSLEKSLQDYSYWL